MSGWVKGKLSDVATIYSGYAFKGKDMNNESGIPLIKIKNINFSRVSKKCDSFLNKEAFTGRQEKYKLLRGDILVAMTGQGSVGRIGKMRGVDKTYLVNQRVGIVRVDKALANAEYVYQYMGRKSIESIYYGLAMGAGQPNLSPADIGNLTIYYPPLPTQQKISKILSNYDDLIENNLKRIMLLEKSARLIYEEWFLHFRIDGKKLDIDAESGLPFGWERKSITSIGDVNKYSISVKTAPKKIKYIDISATETGVYRKPDYLEFKDAPSRARRKLNYGDTIFSTVRPNRKIYALVLEDDPTLIASTGFAVITPKDPLHFPYIYLSLSAQCFIDSAVAVAGGAAYPSINQSSFGRLEVTVPSENILNKFCGSASFYLKTKNVLLNQNQLLIKARDILLPRLMTGMIDTDDMDIAV
jgi:type I restriction enzyme, S subunit